MEDYDVLFSLLWYTTGSLSLFINGLFLYLIIFRSPPSLSPYKIFLANSAVTDIVFSVSNTFLQCRLIPNKWAFAYIALGPSRLFGEQVSYYSYVIQLHSLFYLFLCFPLSFGFRYYILIRPLPSIRQVCTLLFGVWLLPLGQLPLTPITLFSIVLPMFPIYISVVYFYKKVHRCLDQRECLTLQASTKKGHKRLLKALAIQASLPLFFVFPPITIYFLYHIEIIEFTIIEYLVYILFSFMPVTSPLLSLYFIRPYNISLRRMFKRVMGRPPPEGGGSLITKTDQKLLMFINKDVKYEKEVQGAPKLPELVSPYDSPLYNVI